MLAFWAIPTAIAAFLIHSSRLLLFDRRLARRRGRPAAMITTQHVFYFVGALFAAWALLSLFDRDQPKAVRQCRFLGAGRAEPARRASLRRRRQRPAGPRAGGAGDVQADRPAKRGPVDWRQYPAIRRAPAGSLVRPLRQQAVPADPGRPADRGIRDSRSISTRRSRTSGLLGAQPGNPDPALPRRGAGAGAGLRLAASAAARAARRGPAADRRGRLGGGPAADARRARAPAAPRPESAEPSATWC